MGLYKQKFNAVSGEFNLVPSGTIISFKENVANAASLPVTGNNLNDARITDDTGHLYVWNGTSWVDQGDIIDLKWASIEDKPSSSIIDIDDAVSKKHDASDQFNQLVSGEIAALTDKSIPLDADVTLIESAADANAKRKLSWLNIKSTLKTYFDTLYTIVNLGGVSVISVNTTLTVKASGGDFTTIQAALDSLKSKRINSDVTVTISVDPGLFTHTATILFRHPQGNRINLVGAAPVTTTLTSLVSFVGTTGNYVVTLNVANTAGMAIGDYCIIRGSTGTGEYRAVMGCWEITNIPSGTQIVVKNTYRKTVAPTLTITGGSLDCLKTILKFNGCDGFLPGNATGFIYNLAIVGNGTANTDGINITQRGYNFGNHIIYLGYSGSTPHSLGINGFGRYGVAQTSSADVWMWNVAVSNCGSYGVYAYNQAKIAGTGIISSGNVSIGIYATDGAWITAVSSFAIGNATVGFYAFNRAGINAENSEAVGNVYSGFQCLGTSYIYAKTSKALNNGYHGYSSSYNGMIYAQSSVATGNGTAINYYGYWSSNGGHIRADSTTASGNFSGDYYAEHFSFIKVTSYVGSPTFSPAVDTMGNGGAIIRSVVATALKIADTIKNTPAGNIAATDVQAAINELDTEKQASLGFTPENVANKRTSFQVTPDDTHYPSEKLTKDSLDGKAPISHTHTQSNIIDLVDDLKDISLNIILNAFRIAQIGSLTIFGMIKGFMDEYEDETGVDTVNSIHENYNSGDDYYNPTGGETVVENPYTHFKCNDNAANTTVTDNGSGANNGTANVNTSNYSITGKINQAFEFNGTSEYINLNTLLADIKTDTTGSIAFWFKAPSLAAEDKMMFGMGQTGIVLGEYQFIIYAYYGKIKVSLVKNGVVQWDKVTSTLSVDTWYHIAIVQNGTAPIIYINDVDDTHAGDYPVADATAWFSAMTNLNVARLGCHNTWSLGNFGFFPGTIDDFRYYQNQALSESDISSLYNSGDGSEEQNPTSAYDNMTLISNAQIADSVPVESRIVIFEEDVNSITINTDLKAYMSRDDGVTYSQVTLEDEGNYITGARVLSGSVDISGQPSDTDVVYKLTTHNNKNLKIHGVGISWKF